MPQPRSQNVDSIKNGISEFITLRLFLQSQPIEIKFAVFNFTNRAINNDIQHDMDFFGNILLTSCGHSLKVSTM